MNILGLLRERFSEALIPLVGEDVGRLLEMVLPIKETKFGDYQANCAMPLGKKLGKPPREIAEQIIAKLEVADFCEPPEIAGPGFINLRIKNEWLLKLLTLASEDQAKLGIQPVAKPRTYVIDYSSPNVAKPMHVGHIRSTVIGAAIYEVLNFLGHKTISDNHIGDWGTQFGMIIYGYKNFLDQAAYNTDAVQELGRLYKLVNSLIEYHQVKTTGLPTLLEKIETQKNLIFDQTEVVESLNSKIDAASTADKSLAKEHKKENKKLRQITAQLATLKTEATSLQTKLTSIDSDEVLSVMAHGHPDIRKKSLGETAKLHEEDPTNQALWHEFLPPCLAEIDKTYARLHVKFDHTLGESFYHTRLAPVVEDLKKRGLAKKSDGAICVFLEGHKAPMIVQKQDGAFLYATTDLATISYRLEEFQPDAILYVVDHRQSFHFEQLFATAKLCGQENLELNHVSFGTVLGEDGRPYKTRSGTAVGLSGLLDEAVERALKIVSKNDDARETPLFTTQQRQQIAERIGIGAIKYADLAHNRTSDYVFSYNKMLAMNGNTAAYMQYSYARVRSIFARAKTTAQEIRSAGGTLQFATPAERALGMMLLQFSEALTRVATDYRPNHLTSYLFDLASLYSEFFAQCPVLKAENEPLRQSRLLLCDLTSRTLERGLQLLGIEVTDRM